MARWAMIVGFAVATSIGLAAAVHGGTAQVDSTTVVQPGDTLWSIASRRYPSDDIRSRIDQIEQMNGLSSPMIAVGETLHLPA